MKSNIFFSQFLLLIFCALVGFNTDVIAQKPNTKQFPYCDELLPKMKEEAQRQADQTCSTKTTCVQCTERKTGISINSTMVIQPACTNVAIEKAVSENNTAAKAPAMTDDLIQVEILQTPCTKGGITLQAFVPLTCSLRNCQQDSNKGQEAMPAGCINFMWELDGKKAGHGPQLECACGKVATLYVTAPDGSRVTKKVKILNCDSPAGAGNKE